jgi:hypothetical protein
MHAAGMWTAFSVILSGLTVVLSDTQTHCAPTAHRHWPSSRCPRNSSSSSIRFDSVRRLGNGKADYRWAKTTATQSVTAG